MEVLHRRCAGIDISKKDAKVAVRVAGGGRAGTKVETTTWSAMSGEILKLRKFLIDQGVTCVVMEATSDYWKPFYYGLEDAPFEVLLVNAHHAKNMPGRKTDVSDAAWLADLGAHGLLRGSLVPPQAIRQLRDLTRARTGLTQQRTAQYQRLEKTLEDTGIKVSVVASDITGVSVRNMLEALIAGERDEQVLAELAQRRLRAKIPQLLQALEGHFNDHHAFLVRMHLDLIDQYTRAIEDLTRRIEEVSAPFRHTRDLICTVPGISTLVADVVIAETGADMSVFPSAAHLASWAGTCPGANESAGRVKSTHTRHGNRHLKGALGIAAMSVARSPGTYLHAKNRRIAARRGPVKALVAVENDMLVAIWHMLTNDTAYHELGAEYFTHRNPTKARNNALSRLHALGYDVTLTPRDIPVAG